MIRSGHVGIQSLGAVLFLASSGIAADAHAAYGIAGAWWDAGAGLLVVQGTAPKGVEVTVANADTGVDLGTVLRKGKGWRLSENMAVPPCRVQAGALGYLDERDVDNAGENCDDGQPPSLPSVSINSSSSNAATAPADAVTEISQEIAPGFQGLYQLVAINDLGMHCGDLDTRISSILPPFNVLHAQVIERGLDGEPRLLGEGEVEIEYSAASNAFDPALTDDAALAKDGSLYKTNFWDVALQAYAPFYPPGVLDAFYDADPAANVDIGLPVPDVERLFLEDGELHASQQAMPGWGSAYVLNTPQAFNEHIGTLPFFLNFPFGYAADVNWFEAAGVPISVFDDFGRENPYPLMRVQAKIGGATVASLDTVMPISGEAECQVCHAAAVDGGNGSAVQALIDEGLAVATSIDDPATDVPTSASVEWASDINILRLHDLKHATSLEQGYDPATGRANEPVVCQRCHYTPALDLAQAGPSGPENDDPPGSGNPSNGRDQVKHRSMSNVMHSHHATVTGTNGAALFPDMPPAISGGVKRDPLVTADVLEQTCYRCHPGRKTQCMRGAMANGGLVCQDCHGNMAQVGEDFTRGVSPSNPGAFELAADFYDPLSGTPRVPWANEPGCGSCHTGTATNNLAGGANVLRNTTDAAGNLDGIRLLQAYRVGDDKATPIVPANKRFAENAVTAADMPGDPDAVGNPKLYRVSTGHGGLFCEACHGATHAEWPNANPAANDNVAANQLQGHSGTITECTVCHASGSLGLTLNGPHGMHPVGTRNWNEHHAGHAEHANGECRACHGNNGLGTVLSRTAAERSWFCDDGNGTLCSSEDQVITVPKGTVVGCNQCHENEINH